MPPFIKSFLPTAEQFITLLLPILLVSLFAAAFAGWLHVKKGIIVPYTRKIFHFVIFSFAGILQYNYGLPAVSLLGGIVFLLVLFAVLAGKRLWFYRALARVTDAPHEKKFIVLPLLATAFGGILSNIFFPQTAFIGYFVGGWGDAVGEPVGTRWGKNRYTVPTLFGVRATRSLEGSLAVFLVGAVISTICVAQLTGSFWPQALWIGAFCGLAGALVEAVSSHGLDNLTIQFAASGILQYLIYVS